MPENSTSFVMTNISGNLKQVLGDLYGLRTWVEYGFRQCKQELGWTDYRFTFANHQQWNQQGGWKNTLNNLRLITQPLLLFWSINPWMDIFPNSQLLLGFNHLIAAMNQFKPSFASG
jgi:hypothetical protein